MTALHPHSSKTAHNTRMQTTASNPLAVRLLASSYTKPPAFLAVNALSYLGKARRPYGELPNVAAESARCNTKT